MPSSISNSDLSISIYIYIYILMLLKNVPILFTIMILACVLFFFHESIITVSQSSLPFCFEHGLIHLKPSLPLHFVYFSLSLQHSHFHLATNAGANEYERPFIIITQRVNWSQKKWNKREMKKKYWIYMFNIASKSEIILNRWAPNTPRNTPTPVAGETV